jgi:hypothetical protein
MYIWEKEIKKINGEVVTFTDKTTAEYSEDYIKYLSTEEKQTPDKLYINKLLKIKSDILKIFINASASRSELEKALQEVWWDIVRHENNILCDLTGVNNYFDINFRELNKLALKVQDKDFTN